MHRPMGAKSLLPTALIVVVAASACSPFGSSSASGPGPKASASTKAPARPLFDDDFKPVCSGATVSAARPYDKTAKTGHKLVYFSTLKDSGLVFDTFTMPKDWMPSLDAKNNAYAAVDLVVCGKRTSVKFVRDCKNYTIDNKPSNLVVKMYSAKYALTVHGATTGKVLAKKVVAANDSTCPDSEFDVPKDATTMNEYAEPDSDQIVAFARPFVQP